MSDVWEDDNPDELEREWKVRHEKYSSLAIRDGIDEGKETTVQEGFDIGYRSGLAQGLKLGLLSGTLTTLTTFCGQVSGTSEHLPKVSRSYSLRLFRECVMVTVHLFVRLRF